MAESDPFVVDHCGARFTLEVWVSSDGTEYLFAQWQAGPVSWWPFHEAGRSYALCPRRRGLLSGAESPADHLARARREVVAHIEREIGDSMRRGKLAKGYRHDILRGGARP